MNAKRETLKEAGYASIRMLAPKEYILTDKDGKEEFWVANKGHASYGIRYRNTDLEFVSSNPK